MNNSENVLKIGVSSLNEIEEKIKAFRAINLNVNKKRYIIIREDIYSKDKSLILKKAEDIDIVKVKLLQRNFKGNHQFKTFQPDEGMVLVSDMNSKAGIKFSMDLVTQTMNIGGGAYEVFVDRVDDLAQMHKLLKKNLFPKLVIIGYLPLESLDKQRALYSLIAREDPYIRFLEINHTSFKPIPLFSTMRVKQVNISPEDQNSWKRFILEVIQEYTKPYLTEDR